MKCGRLGDYELLEELGQGGMGVVYRARHVLLGQTVAVKVLPDRYLDDPQAVARFRREMQSIGALDHPNIVRAFNAGEAAGMHFLVMEYVDGLTLQRLLADRMEREQGPLGVGAACEVISQAALGLQHAHEHGLVHRDIKPANLIVSRSGVVKLLDLGLAKFRADRLSRDSSAGPLTEAGMKMGTVDYMAPEQWEDSSAVDIRADVYSLGCTLFFLLTGGPPYGDKRYDSNHKRLLAHAVAPVPSLSEACPGCPEDVARMLDHMMAKEPEDRFDTPGELAEAIGLFADPDELLQCLPAASTADPSSTGRTSGTAGGQGGTSRPVSGQSAKRRKPGFSMAKRRDWNRRPWYRRIRPLAAGLGLTLLLALGDWLVVQATRSKSAQENGDTRSISTDTPAALDRHRTAVELALLPGLNGPWWFDEMPWYLPFVRQVIAQTVESTPDVATFLGGPPAAYLDPNAVKVQQWLWSVVDQYREKLSESQKHLLDELKELADTNLDNAKLATRLDKSLAQFVQDHETAWSAADRHTQALLLHKIAALKSDGDLARRAKDAYDEAEKQYAEVPEDVAGQLRLFCVSDSARLCGELLGDFREARRRFDGVLARDDLPDLFHVEVLAAYGDNCTTAGEYQDRLFDEARRIVKSSQTMSRSHPLAAYVAERHAWSLMDQWKVGDAADRFTEATSIRQTNKREGNPFATIYVLHDRHGTALTLRYRGRDGAAKILYKKLVGGRILGDDRADPGEIQLSLEEAEANQSRPGWQRYLSDLRERLANSMERWADCELYGGAASGRPVNLLQAGRLLEKARERTSDYGTSVTLACKLCIVEALQPKKKDEAAKILAALDAGKKEFVGTERERSALMRETADAVLKLESKDADEGRSRLARVSPQQPERDSAGDFGASAVLRRVVALVRS